MVFNSLIEAIINNKEVCDFRDTVEKLDSIAEKIESIEDEERKEKAFLKEKAKHGVSFCNKNIEGGLSK